MFDDGSGKTRNAAELRRAAKYVDHIPIFNFMHPIIIPELKLC